MSGPRNRFGHLPDQSMHEKTAVADLNEEMYVFVQQADEVSLNDLLKELKTACASNAPRAQINVIIARIDAGLGNQRVGGDLGDTFKEMVAGDRDLKARGAKNTTSQFETAT